ncbi:hepatic lectin-like isoform X2 [Embiotoca jacksoni]|uniref:hepatic lectin-like isoform X2 n=1 Tax=Embiotoca jacksoni TaxID=100190 RepID=UPI003703FF9A
MTEADVLYSDVKFNRTNGQANGRGSSSADTTYSEVKIFKTQSSTELPGRGSSSADTTYSEVKIFKTQSSTELPACSQQAASSRKSNVTAKRAALLVVSVLLAAAVIALIVTTTNSETKPGSTLQPTSTPLPEKNNRTSGPCDEGWEHHGGQCYYFSINKLTWQVSRQECIFEGGDLVKIDSRDEQEFLARRLRDQMMEPEDKFWIGLTDSKEEGRWLWVDGSPLDTSLTFWYKREPDNWNVENPEGEDCVRMGEKDGSHDLMCWFDKSCKIPHRRICEKSAVSV